MAIEVIHEEDQFADFKFLSLRLPADLRDPGHGARVGYHPLVILFSIPGCHRLASSLTGNSLLNANLMGFLILLGSGQQRHYLIDYTNLLRKRGFRVNGR